MLPEALVTLRAHLPAPAHIELAYRPLSARVARSLLLLIVCWGAIPLIAWIPPHYPWIVLAFAAGLYFARRQFSGRYRVSCFAGLCPRCGQPVSLGQERCIDLPHTLTCFNCHCEPTLEVHFAEEEEQVEGLPEHREPVCVGRWQGRWLADVRIIICSHCRASCTATEEALEQAKDDNERADLLDRLTREGRTIL